MEFFEFLNHLVDLLRAGGYVILDLSAPVIKLLALGLLHILELGEIVLLDNSFEETFGVVNAVRVVD